MAYETKVILKCLPTKRNFLDKNFPMCYHFKAKMAP